MIRLATLHEKALLGSQGFHQCHATTKVEDIGVGYRLSLTSYSTLVATITIPYSQAAARIPSLIYWIRPNALTISRTTTRQVCRWLGELLGAAPTPTSVSYMPKSEVDALLNAPHGRIAGPPNAAVQDLTGKIRLGVMWRDEKNDATAFCKGWGWVDTWAPRF